MIGVPLLHRHSVVIDAGKFLDHLSREELAAERTAIPRRVYTDNHLDYVADVAEVFEERRQVRGFRVVNLPAQLAIFTASVGRA